MNNSRQFAEDQLVIATHNKGKLREIKALFEKFEFEESELPKHEIEETGFKIMFAGNIGTSQSFELIIAAAERLKENKDIKWIDINPCFVFHPMNAYEEDNKIILHVCRQDKAMVGGMDQIYGGDETTGKLWKWTLDLDTQSCKEEQIDDKPCDFARVDDRRTGLKANIGYAMELNNKAETLTFGNNLFKSISV